MVNRLRQVTSAIKQDGANQVSIITSTAERQAAIEFGKAQAMRPQIVGEALKQMALTRMSSRPCLRCSRSNASGQPQQNYLDPGSEWSAGTTHGSPAIVKELARRRYRASDLV